MFAFILVLVVTFVFVVTFVSVITFVFAFMFVFVFVCFVHGLCGPVSVYCSTAALYPLVLEIHWARIVHGARTVRFARTTADTAPER